VRGHGTIGIESGSTVDVDRVVAGLRINLDSGTLVDTRLLPWYPGASFLATVHEAAAGVVDVLNASAAVKETFDIRTDMLSLLNESNGIVASVQFAGDARYMRRRMGMAGST
jgi:hypothetical protein